MTAVEWLIEELKKVHHPTEAMIMYAKKLEKQQIIDAYYGQSYSTSVSNGEQYYNETYGSKGSDDKFDVLKEMFELELQLDIPSHKGSGETKPHPFCETPEEKCTMSYCDENGCINRKRNLAAEPIENPITSSQTEISDEEIFYQKQVMNPYPSTKHFYTAWEKGFMDCAKWYREQLKNKQ